MVLCKYFQQGNCSFGSKCQNDHFDVKQMLKIDMETAINGKQWPLSCYGPFKDKACIPDFVEDQSFEEVRFMCYEAKQKNYFEQFHVQFTQRVMESTNKMKSLQNVTMQMVEIATKIHDAPIDNKSSGTSAFGATNNSNAFGANSFLNNNNANNTTGNIFALSNNNNNTQNSNPFGATNSNVQPPQQASASIFGQAQNRNQSNVFSFNTANNTNNNNNSSSNIFGQPAQQTAGTGIFAQAAQQTNNNNNTVGAGIFSQAVQQTNNNNIFQQSNTNSSSIFAQNAFNQQQQPQQQTNNIFSSNKNFMQPVPQPMGAVASQPTAAQTLFAQAAANSIFSKAAATRNPLQTGNIFAQQPQQLQPQQQMQTSSFQQQQPQDKQQPQQQQPQQQQPLQQQQQPPQQLQQQMPKTMFMLGAYSRMEDLTAEEIDSFQAPAFLPGKIPFSPPPRELIQ